MHEDDDYENEAADSDYENEAADSDYENFVSEVDHRPMVIVYKMGKYTPRRFRRAVRKFSKHFGIPANLPALIAMASMHDYELAVFGSFALVFRVDTVFNEIVKSEPIVLMTALMAETDNRVVQFI